MPRALTTRQSARSDYANTHRNSVSDLGPMVAHLQTERLTMNRETEDLINKAIDGVLFWIAFLVLMLALYFVMRVIL